MSALQIQGEVLPVVGLQRGDEGKGRFVDMLAPGFDVGARWGGGDNAGHTVYVDGVVYKLHGLPTTIVHEHAKSVMGNGVVVNPIRLCREIDTLAEQGIEVSPAHLLISGGANLTLPHHISEDEIIEGGASAQGSTKSGIAPVYGTKYYRQGTRAEIIKNDPDELFERIIKGLDAQREQRAELGLPDIDAIETAKEYVACAKRLGEFVTDTARFLNYELRAGKKVLAEGAQAFLLDIDHGMAPFTTSSSTIAGSVSNGLGIPPQAIRNVFGVAKAVQSHVGGGPFLTEITDPDLLSQLHGDMQTVDAERGTTTGRTRRLGHLDLAGLRRANMINGTTEMALTKLDWVPRYGEEVLLCVAYHRKGKILPDAVDLAYKIEESQPVYETLPTWVEDIQDVRRFEDLPGNAKDYIMFIEEQTGVPITHIGVGPDREQVIVR